MYGRECMNEKENDVLSQLKNNIKTLIENDNLLVAKELLKQYKNIVTDDIEIYSIEAVIFMKENRYYEALDLLIEGLELDSRNFDLLYNVAYIYEKIEQYDEAIDFYEKTISVSTSHEVMIQLQEKVKEIFAEHKDSIIKKRKKEESIRKSVENGEILSAIVVDIINDLEEQIPVEKWVVDNVHIWSLIRNNLFGLTADDSNKRIFNSKENKENKENSIHEIKSKKCMDFLKNEVDAVFLSRAGFRSQIDGVWYSRFCDPIVDEFENMNLKTLSLEYLAGDNQYRYPEYRNSMHIQKHLNYVANRNEENMNINYSLLGFKTFLYKLETLKIKTGLNIPHFSLQGVLNEYILIRRLSNYFKMIFLNVKPKVGFVSVYQNHIGYAFCLACRECGIVSVDIQHGISSDNGVYVSWNKLPKEGYELLPNYFWRYDKTETEEIKKWTKNISEIHNIVNGGNPWVEMCLKDNKNMLRNINNNIKDKLSTLLNRSNSINILYAHTTPGEIPHLVLRAIQESPSNWNWLIRFHPMTPEKDKHRDINLLKSLKNPNIEYIYSTELPLLGLFNFVNVNINLGSSITVESMQFGIPSILIVSDQKYFEKSFKSAFDKGLATIANIDDNLLELIHKQVNKTKSVVHKASESKIKSAIEKIFYFHKSEVMNKKAQKIIEKNEKFNNQLIFEIGVIEHYEQIELCLKYNDIEKLKKYFQSIKTLEERQIFREYIIGKANSTELIKSFPMSI